MPSAGRPHRRPRRRRCRALLCCREGGHQRGQPLYAAAGPPAHRAGAAAPRSAGRRRGPWRRGRCLRPALSRPAPALSFFCRRRCHPSPPADSAGPAPPHWAVSAQRAPRLAALRRGAMRLRGALGRAHGALTPCVPRGPASPWRTALPAAATGGTGQSESSLCSRETQTIIFSGCFYSCRTSAQPGNEPGLGKGSGHGGKRRRGAGARPQAGRHLKGAALERASGLGLFQGLPGGPRCSAGVEAMRSRGRCARSSGRSRDGCKSKTVPTGSSKRALTAPTAQKRAQVMLGTVFCPQGF